MVRFSHGTLRSLGFAPLFLVALIVGALAGPEGVYDVAGKDLGTGNPYSGTVEVVRTGKTYSVRWDIGGASYVGSGLGAAPIKGMSVVGPADENDYVLAVGYIAGNQGFGLAYYVQQEDGSWKGIWTYGGSEELGSEVWTPR